MTEKLLSTSNEGQPAPGLDPAAEPPKGPAPAPSIDPSQLHATIAGLHDRLTKLEAKKETPAPLQAIAGSDEEGESWTARLMSWLNS